MQQIKHKGDQKKAKVDFPTGSVCEFLMPMPTNPLQITDSGHIFPFLLVLSLSDFSAFYTNFFAPIQDADKKFKNVLGVLKHSGVVKILWELTEDVDGAAVLQTLRGSLYSQPSERFSPAWALLVGFSDDCRWHMAKKNGCYRSYFGGCWRWA